MTQETAAKKIFDGRYEILGIVGRGAASVVYHARDINNPAAEVALKVLKPQKAVLHDLPTNAERLRKEALAMVSSRHRFVIRLDDFHSVDELCYLAMEFAPESDLRRYRAKLGGKLPMSDIELYLSQAAEALAFMHKGRVIHRDIKPENILVVSEKEIRLGDFGVAVLPGEESSLTELQRGVGTMSYMAPEVLAGIRYDEASDVYALGVTFYELLTGHHPFDNAPLMQQLDVRKDDAFSNPRALNPEIPEYLATVIVQAMSFDAAKRFPSGVEFLQALRFNRAQAKGKKRFSVVEGGHGESVQGDGTTGLSAAIDEAPSAGDQLNIDKLNRDAAPSPGMPLAVSGNTALDITPVPLETTPPVAATTIESIESTHLAEQIEKVIAPDAGTASENRGAKTTEEKGPELNSVGAISETTTTAQAETDAIPNTSSGPINSINVDQPMSQPLNSSPIQSILEEPMKQAVGAESIPFPISSAGTLIPGAAQSAISSSATAEPALNTVSQTPITQPPSSGGPAHKTRIGIPRISGGPGNRSGGMKLNLRGKMPSPTTKGAPAKEQDSPVPIVNHSYSESVTPPVEMPTAGVASADSAALDSAPANSADNTPEGAQAVGANQGISTEPSIQAKNTAAAVQSEIKHGITPGFGLSVQELKERLNLSGRRLTILLIVLMASIVGGILMGRTGQNSSNSDSLSALHRAANKGTGPVAATDLLPTVTTRDFTFPDLPRGIYSGKISNLIPGTSLVLTFLVLSPDEMVVLIGIPGWTPRAAILDRPVSDDGSKPIRVAANGLILDLVGANVDGELMGGYTNVVTGTRGEWRARPNGL